MAKRHSRTIWYKNLFLVVPILIVVLLLAGYLGRGWVRKSLVPSIAGLVYANRIQHTLDKQYDSLGKPLEALGLTHVKATKRCWTVYAKHFKTQLNCTATYSAYSNTGSSLTPNLAVRANNLAAVLSKNGWVAGNTSLQTLGGNIQEDIDWTPDAAYIKNVDGAICLADFNTAYAKPKLPALAGSINCSRPVQFF